MSWRKDLRDPQQRLAAYKGTARSYDGPVALFTLANGKDVGLSMADIGDAFSIYLQLGYFENRTPETEWITREMMLATSGAHALFRQHGVSIDPRLRQADEVDGRPADLNANGRTMLAQALRASGPRGPVQ